MIDRLHLQHQALKCLSLMSEDDPEFFVTFSKIFSDDSLPLEFNESPNLNQYRNSHRKSKLKEWITQLINRTCIDILQSVVEDPDIPAVIFWEMGNFYDPQKDYTQEDLENIKLWAINEIEKNRLGPNKSLISFKIFVQSKQLYFCIPLPLLSNTLALEAMRSATPMRSHTHQRSPERLQSLYENNLPFNIMRKQPA